jgi:hypothetical protein
VSRSNRNGASRWPATSQPTTVATSRAKAPKPAAMSTVWRISACCLAICPECARQSERVHSRFRRYLSDAAIGGAGDRAESEQTVLARMLRRCPVPLT